VEEEIDNIEEELEEDAGDKTEVGLSVHKTSVTDISDVGDISVDDAEDAPQSFIDKIKAKFKKKSSAEVDDEDEKIAKKPLGKRPINKKILYGAIGVIMLVVFWDDIVPPEEPVVAPPAFQRPIRKKPVPPPVDTVVAPVPDVAPVPETIAVTPVENPDIASIPDADVSVAPETTTPVLEDGPDLSVPAPQVVPEETVTAPDSTTTAPDGDVVDSDVKPISDENVTDQILEDLEKQATEIKEDTNKKKDYMAPPDYEYRGRGLVYNCVGKHWACVDAPSYKTCEGNSAGNKYLKKSVECFPFNVYESVKGCENMQSRMVSTSAKTSFCK